jgi:hypothetical protein
MWSNRWSTMPIRVLPQLRPARPDARARLERWPGTDVPVIRQPFDPSDDLPYWGRGRFHGDLLYDRAEADAEGAVRNLAGDPDDKDTKRMQDLLVEAMRAIDAPAEQLTRLGLG